MPLHLRITKMFMKNVLLSGIIMLGVLNLHAQDESKEKKNASLILPGRANDHFMFQVGSTGWSGSAADTLKFRGLSKSINGFFMFDYPIRTSPRLSTAFGLGIASDQMQLKARYVGIKDQTSSIVFRNVADTTHFKKNKLTTTYLEAPIELRYTRNPLKPDASFKAAIGIRVGTLIRASMKYKTLENKSGNTINEYTMKEASKLFFNKTRMVATARAGVGNFTIFGSYQLTTLFKEGAGIEVRPYTIGLTISGL